MTRQTGDPLDNILATLKTTEDPRVILLDSFETPWHPIEGNQESVRDVFRALALLPLVAILGTMRSEFRPFDEWIYIPLSHVEPEESRQIFDSPAGNDPKLDELLHILGHLQCRPKIMQHVIFHVRVVISQQRTTFRIRSKSVV